MSDKNPKVSLKTSLGEIVLELNPEKAPLTVKNFLHYVEAKFYDGLIFHRVIPNFMIQGGGMTAQMKEKSGHIDSVKNEADNGLKNDLGTIAMARTMSVDSATSQFFINTKSNDFLNHKDKTPRGYGYAVFGKVISGIDVVHKIEKVETTSSGMHDDVPTSPVTIESARVITF